MLGMVGALVPDVTDDRIESTRRDGLGPIADLPHELIGAWELAVQSAARRALEALRELGHGDARRMAYEDMDVIGSHPDGEHGAVEMSGLALEHVGEPAVEAWFEPRCPTPRRPDEVDEEDGHGVRVPRERGAEGFHPLKSTPAEPRLCTKNGNTSGAPLVETA